MKKNIGILILNSPNINNYAHSATLINYLYSTKYNYDFIVERCPLKEDLSKNYIWDGKNEYLLVWSKPSLIKKHLINYDYLFYIDSDAIFIDHFNSIEYFIDNNFSNDTCLLLSNNCITKYYCFNESDTENRLNAGVIVAKNTNITFEILDKWIEAPNTDICKEWKFKHPREQECLNILKNVLYNDKIKIIDNYNLNGIDGDWIKHYMEIDKNKRIKILNLYLKKFLIENNIYDKTNNKYIYNKKQKNILSCYKDKVCIIMIKTNNIIGTMINYIYSTKFGYNFIILESPIIVDKYIKYYDYILILDNSFIINMDIEIKEFINDNNNDIIIINNNNYLIKSSYNKSYVNINNNTWLDNKVNFNILNNLFIEYNYLYDVDYNINNINKNIDDINNYIYNLYKKKYFDNLNNKQNIDNKQYFYSLYLLIIFMFILILIFIYFNRKK